MFNVNTSSDVVLAISNDDRARAFDECHPERRKILDRVAFVTHVDGKRVNSVPNKRPVDGTPKASDDASQQ
jgi:hypothetical protein